MNASADGHRNTETSRRSLRSAPLLNQLLHVSRHDLVRFHRVPGVMRPSLDHKVSVVIRTPADGADVSEN